MLVVASHATAATSLTYVYDANGNLIQGDAKYYEYNDANQLIRVKYGDANGTVLAEYFYDYTGQRIKKVENGTTTYYIGKHFEKQVDSAGSATNTSYYFANGERVAKKDTLGNIYYYHLDHLGGTNVLTDSSGNLIERIKYYPFGEIKDGGNEKYSFTRKEKDKQTDFYYFEARYYNPEFKHFTQSDTVAPNLYNPQDLNRYTYVRNNPIKLIDPSGNSFWEYTKSFFTETAKQISNPSTAIEIAHQISKTTASVAVKVGSEVVSVLTDLTQVGAAYVEDIQAPAIKQFLSTPTKAYSENFGYVLDDYLVGTYKNSDTAANYVFNNSNYGRFNYKNMRRESANLFEQVEQGRMSKEEAKKQFEKMVENKKNEIRSGK